MAIPTVAVICRIYDQDGSPVQNAIVRAQLQNVSIYNGYVLKETSEITTDEEGMGILHLWPNVLGTIPSTYKFTNINVDGNGGTYRFFAQVPNNDIYLDQLVQLDPDGIAIPGAGGAPLPGTPGRAATITVGTVQTVEANVAASVVNSGTASDAIFDFKIPRGPQGLPGLNGTGTMVVGSVTTLPSDQQATVVNVGTADRAILNFGIPQGPPGPPGTGGTGGNLVGIPVGGTVGQVLKKIGTADYAVGWGTDNTGGGTGGTGGIAEKYHGIYAWEGGGVIPVLSPLDTTTQSEYAAAITAATSGAKRLAGANALITAFGGAQRITLTRNGIVMLTADFTGSLTLYDDGTNIGVGLSTLTSVSAIASGDIDTGTWQAVFAGGAGYSRTATLTVGVAGAGKHLTLDADTAAGNGFNPSFTLIVPRSADGL
jgi:hypothetical protein